MHAVAALGGHAGAQIAELLAADGVPTVVVALSGETRTCSAIVELGGGASSTDLYEPATPLTPTEWPAFAEAASALVTDDKPWVALSGSLPAGAPVQEVAALMRRLRAAGARIAVDSSGEALRALGPHADLVKVNRAEAAEVLGSEQPDSATAARALQNLLQCAVLVTDGVLPGAARIGGEELPIAAPATTGRFSAGSGDAFLGGLLAAFDRGDSPADGILLATLAAERNAQVPGQGVLG